MKRMQILALFRKISNHLDCRGDGKCKRRPGRDFSTMKKKSTAEAEQSAWWQPHAVQEGCSLELQLGPLNLTVGRASQAWLVAIDREQHDSDSLSRCQLRDGLPDRFDE